MDVILLIMWFAMMASTKNLTTDGIYIFTAILFSAIALLNKRR